MNHRRILVAMLALSTLPFTLHAQSVSPQLSSVLSKMNTASKNFRTASADFNCQYYERVVQDTTTQTGIIYFLRKGDATQMGSVFYGPDKTIQKVIEYKDGRLQIFDPTVNQITVLQAGGNQEQFEKYLTLGFGGSGAELARTWNIKDLGPQTLSNGNRQVVTEKLDLTTKDPHEKTFSHISIWVEPTQALSLRQIFYLTNDDRRTCNFSDIKLNGHLDLKAFRIKKNSKTTTVNR